MGTYSCELAFFFVDSAYSWTDWISSSQVQIRSHEIRTVRLSSYTETSQIYFPRKEYSFVVNGVLIYTDA